PLVEDLLERRLVALALVLGPHEDRRAPARGKPDLRKLRRGPGRTLDRIDNGEAAQYTPPARRIAPRRKARDVSQVQRARHTLWKIAAVIGYAERRLVRHRGGGNEILAPELQPVHSELARRIVDQALDDVGRLGPPGSAVRRRRVGVGQ